MNIGSTTVYTGFIKLLSSHPTDLCKLRPDSGPCLALIRSYFFNSSSGRCELFNYGGCKGNANRCGSLIMNKVYISQVGVHVTSTFESLFLSIQHKILLIMTDNKKPRVEQAYPFTHVQRMQKH